MIDDEERQRRARIAAELDKLVADVYRMYGRDVESLQFYSVELLAHSAVLRQKYSSNDRFDKTQLWHFLKGSNLQRDFPSFDFLDDNLPGDLEGEVEKFVRAWARRHLCY